MRHRWLSRRALLLHLSLVVWFPGCLIAFWWQVHRAFAGNGLSYLYSVEWPVFAVTGVWAWWQLVHTDPESVGRRAQERMAAASAVGAGETAGSPASPLVGQGARPLSADPGDAGTGQHVATPIPLRRPDQEDPELAAYNDRLARLAAEGPKTWKRR